jgi:hypothetical protein
VISFCAVGRDSISALRRLGSNSPKMSSIKYTGALLALQQSPQSQLEGQRKGSLLPLAPVSAAARAFGVRATSSR